MIESLFMINKISVRRRQTLLVLILLGYFSMIARSRAEMELIAVYEGPGAVLADEVEEALKKLDFSFRGLKYAGGLDKYSREGLKVFIVPGGFTVRIAKGWGEKEREAVRKFVARGGAYIGICAGAYLAADVVEVAGRPPGLGIISVRNQRRSGLEVVKIRLVDPSDPIARNCPEEMKIWYQNGPFMEAGEGCLTVAAYENGAGAIVRGSFGKGNVILFSAHPEGSREFGVDGEKLGSLVLLRNALSWVLGNYEGVDN